MVGNQRDQCVPYLTKRAMWLPVAPRMIWGVPWILSKLDSPKEGASAFPCSFHLFELNKKLGSAWSSPPLPPDTCTSSHNEASAPELSASGKQPDLVGLEYHRFLFLVCSDFRYDDGSTFLLTVEVYTSKWYKREKY